MGQVVVTGSASGIGAGIARALAADGLEIVGWDVASVEWPVDVTDEAQVRGAAARLPVGIEGVVLAAGVSAMAPLEDTTTEQWNFQMQVNAFGVFNCLRALIPHVREGGSIVVIASVGGLRGAALLSAYCASKFAVVGLVQSVAVELGSRMRINAIAPMYVHTPMEDRELAWEASLRGMTVEEVRAGYVRGTPLGRIAEPDDIADVVRFLMSPASRYMTGATVTVSGGADLL